mmetsp:Transcript_18645/g.46549  ORF Transcript_18645/g.46549 Transcript_18645/m.46549 type:complete len:233 (+) Transcript_18645:111-809(+)|eukprot:g11350.t1
MSQTQLFEVHAAYDRVRLNEIQKEKKRLLSTWEHAHEQVRRGPAEWNGDKKERFRDPRLFQEIEEHFVEPIAYTAKNAAIARRCMGPPDFRMARSTTSLCEEPLDPRTRRSTRRRAKPVDPDAPWPSQLEHWTSGRVVDFPPAKTTHAQHARRRSSAPSNTTNCKSCYLPHGRTHDPCPMPPDGLPFLGVFQAPVLLFTQADEIEDKVMLNHLMSARRYPQPKGFLGGHMSH